MGSIGASLMRIGYDKYSMIIDGRREFIRSGAMHYFRLPSQQLWRDRLYKLKAAGYNTVDLYFCWHYHSPAPGVYDFTGIRDVEALLALTQELGLWLIARPGPYINAEYTSGGLPAWLVAMKDIKLRNRLDDGTFQWDERYMAYVEEWWRQIVPKINQAPNLLMMQIENEYGTADMEPDYMQALYDLSRSLGVTVPLMHNDLYVAGCYEDIVDIYAFDHYSVTRFETNWRYEEGVFGIIDTVEQKLRRFCENRPLMVAELQAGWFGTWCGYRYDKIIESLGREHISITTKSLIGQGVTVYNHYKAIGGTNWNTIGSTDTYTSYDFGAPISESGILTDRLYEVKALNYLLQSFDLAATERVVELPPDLAEEPALYAMRQAVERPETQWLVLRNMTQASMIALVGELSVLVKRQEALLLPRRVLLKCGYELLATTVEPIWQNENTLFVKGNRPVDIRLALQSEVPTLTRESGVSVEHLGNHHYRVTCPELPVTAFEEVRLGKLTLFILGQHLIDRFWVNGESECVVLGPDTRFFDGSYGLSTTREVITVTCNGTVTREKGYEIAQPPRLPVIKQWQAYHEARELYHLDHYGPVTTEGLDFDALGVYEGSGWYALPLDGLRPAQITLNARHIWAVFVNDTFIEQGHHLVVEPDADDLPPVTVPIPPSAYREGQPNHLVIFVDSLGHPKGFHNDAGQVQGLLSLEVDGRPIPPGELLFSAGLATWKRHLPIPKILEMDNPPPHSPVIRLETCFTLELPENLVCPMGLQISGLDCERVNLYLNGVLLGRHWRACQSQNTFYLPEGILKTGETEENLLELVLINFDPYLSLTEGLPLPDQVRLKPYGVFTKRAL